MEYLGIGVGLRRKHFLDVQKDILDIDWFELVSENFMSFGSNPRQVITHLKNLNVPMICHGLGLSLGGDREIPQDYLLSLKELLNFTQSAWFSDHLCISSSLKHQYHDLLPILKTAESLQACIDKIKLIQDYYQRPFAIENISYYGESAYNTMSESEFINKLIEQTGCYLLLDINNVYVNQQNLKMDAKSFLNSMPQDKVIQIHLAGHYDRGDVLIDTHGEKVPDKVWDLYRWYLKESNRKITTLIEWDNNIPSYEELNNEVLNAKKIVSEVFHEA